MTINMKPKAAWKNAKDAKEQSELNTPEAALRYCFGGGLGNRAASWTLKEGTTNVRCATFESDYTDYLQQFLTKHNSQLGVTSYTQTASQNRDRKTIFVTTDDPMALAQKVMNSCKRLGYDNFLARYVAHIAKGIGSPG